MPWIPDANGWSFTWEPDARGGPNAAAQPCCCTTKKGNACPFGADRLRDGNWYCHVHDPDGAAMKNNHAARLLRSPPPSPPEKTIHPSIR